MWDFLLILAAEAGRTAVADLSLHDKAILRPFRLDVFPHILLRLWFVPAFSDRAVVAKGPGLPRLLRSVSNPSIGFKKGVLVLRPTGSSLQLRDATLCLLESSIIYGK